MSHIKGINHIGLTVLDIEEATTFLKEAFGAKIAYDALTYEDEPRGRRSWTYVRFIERC